jgi:hypothetical protein
LNKDWQNCGTSVQRDAASPGILNTKKWFGFRVVPANAPPNEPAEFCMLVLFSPRSAAGPVFFHQAFYEST